MLRRLLLALSLLSSCIGSVYAQNMPGQASPGVPVGPTALGNAVQSFAGLQFAAAQSGIGAPAGSMASYSLGDNITLQCSGVTFSNSPVVGVTGVSGGAVTAHTIANPGLTTNAIPSGSITCTQASTSGTGTGYQVTLTFGLVAAYLQPASLGTGGGSANGNFFLNQGPSDMSGVIAGAENTFVGAKAGLGFTGNSGFNTALGHNACGNGGATVAGVNNNVCLGTDAGRNPQTVFSGIVAVGSGAGRNAANTGSIYIGQNAGGSGGSNTPGLETGNTNVAIGFLAGGALTSGSSNTFIGQRVGSAVTTGGNNIMLGSGSGSDNCANGNESSVFAVCNGGNGRTITNTGGATPSTSVTTFAGVIVSAGITTDATHTDATVCEDTTTHQFYFGSGTAGVCLGTSSARFKHNVEDLTAGLDQIMGLRAVSYEYNADHGDPNHTLYGFTAEDMAKVLPRLVGTDAEGMPNSADYLGVVPVLVRGMQQQQKEIEALKAANDNRRCIWRLCVGGG